MSTAPAVAPIVSNLEKTEQCVELSYHFHMGIGKMRQIATKVIDPTAANIVGFATNASQKAVVVTTAQASELRSQKRLMNSSTLDEITSQDGKLKRFIESQSANAGEAKRFLLRSELVRVWRVLEAYRTVRRPALVAEFMAEYRALEALDFAPLKDLLGDQFVRGDYRPSDEVEAGFVFTYRLHNVGDINLTGIPAEIADQERAKEREQRSEVVEEFKHVLRATLIKFVDSLFNQVKPNVDGKRRCFQDSCVENVLTFISNFDKQDMAQDAAMQPIIASLKGVLKGVTPAMVKESDNLQATLTSKLSEVKATLGALVVESGRKFR